MRKEQLADAMAGMRAFGMRGVNLTIPHKVEVLKYLDALSPAAEIIGAVNFELWTGEKAPLGVMEATLRAEFGL